jgi:signal-transduction protein with cAMP-binding, CBS, and nucleotidyltransferase domain
MRDNDCGAVPIVDAGCVVGIITDRDLVIRALADDANGDTPVSNFITASPHCASPNDDVRDVESVMVDNQVRRVPIVDAKGGCLGIVSQADLARAALHGQPVTEHEVARVVERISEPRRMAFEKRREQAMRELQ